MPKHVTKGRITQTKPTPKRETMTSKIEKKLPVKPKPITQKQSAPKTSNNSSYSAKNIQVLEGLEAVRKRPGMYIGSTGSSGLHHLIWEVVDNAIDEAMAGYAKRVVIRLLPGRRVSVADDGRGIPIDLHKQTKKSAIETVMTTLHAGAKVGGGSYKV